MNLKVFPTSTTNVFPAVNTHTGGQLLTEYNLRLLDSVATPSSIKYFTGASFCHSRDDFSLSGQTDGTGVRISNTVLEIGPGRAVVNGHAVESLIPIDIDLVELNKQAQEADLPTLSGKLSVGLRAMYSTQQTLAGSILTEHIDGDLNKISEYFEGIQVVILPQQELKTPLDCPDNPSEVTAHIKLGSFNFMNGSIHPDSIDDNYPQRCQMLSSDRIGDMGDSMGSVFVRKTGLDHKKLYVFSGKGTNPETGFDTWCEANDSLMIWDPDPQLTNESPYTMGMKTRSSQFVYTEDERTKLLLIHKEIDNMKDQSGASQWYKNVYLPLPLADYNTYQGGTVGGHFIQWIRKIKENADLFYQIHKFPNSQLRLFIRKLESHETVYTETILGPAYDWKGLPYVRKDWNVGDYVIVSEDVMLAETEDGTSRGPSTMYLVLPGPVENIAAYETGDSTTGNIIGTAEYMCESREEYDKMIDSSLSNGVSWAREYFNIDADTFMGTVGDIIEVTFMVTEDKNYYKEVKLETPDPIEGFTKEEIVQASGAPKITRVYSASKLGILDDNDPRQWHALSDSLDEEEFWNHHGFNRGFRHWDGAWQKLHDPSIVNGENLLTNADVLNVCILGGTWTVVNKPTATVNAYAWKTGEKFTETVTEIDEDTGKEKEVEKEVDGYACVVAGYCDESHIHASEYRTATEIRPITMQQTCQYIVTEENTDGRQLDKDNPIILTGGISLATTSSIGGFFDVDPSEIDQGYVYVDGDGHLRLMDYALLRSGVLAYQLGENISISGNVADIQSQLNDYVNQRVAFPSTNHTAEATVNKEDPNEIRVTLEFAETGDSKSEINVYDIDSRFNTNVKLILNGSGTGLTVNVSDITKLKIENNLEGEYKLNVYRCGLFYNPEQLNKITKIEDMSLWYQRYSETDPAYMIDGMTVIDCSNQILADDIEYWTDTINNDNHYSFALQSVTFSPKGSVIGAGIYVKNNSSNNVSLGKYLVGSKFRLGGNNLTFPKSWLKNEIRISGSFTGAYPSQSPIGFIFTETKVQAVLRRYDSDVDENLIGSITFYSNSEHLDMTSTEGLDPEYTPDSQEHNAFHVMQGWVTNWNQ